MKTFRPVLLSVCGLSTLGLAACGEGYEVVQVRGTVPYVEERTAGPGIAYVRAHMMPEKTVILPASTETRVQDAAPIFEQKIQKK